MSTSSPRTSGTTLPALLAPHPDLCRFLVDRHVARPDGRCRGCGSEVGPREWWPCRLYLAADEARRIARCGA